VTETPRHACKECTRTDLSLTANGRVRSHAADGRRPGPDNPNCPGGSDWPKHDHDYAPAGTSGYVCTVCGETDLRPTASEILAGPNPYRAPLPDHVHRYEYVAQDQTRGQFVCAVCGSPEGLPPGWTGPSPLMNQRFMEYLKNRTPEQKLATALSMDATASAVLGLPLDPELPHDRHTDTPTEDDPWQTRSTHPVTAAAPDPGSAPRSNPTATDAGAVSTPATSSGPTETAGTRGRTAAVTTETADAFDSATAPVQRAEQRVERDGYGRYRLIHPVTGKKQAWQRCTTFAKMLEDTFGLGKWQRRMAAKGLALRPDLLDMIATLEVKQDSQRMDLLLEQAMDAAGQKVAANQGTVCHKHTEDVDRGDSLDDVPPKYRADVTAYVKAIRDAGITIVPELIERITAVPDLGVGGTLDRVVRDRHGKYRILDVKTGNMDFGQLGICVQLAVYAAGVNTAGVYDLDTGTWQQGPKVETDYALVAHIPVGSGTCELLKVPIDTGWEAVQTAVQVRDWRKMKRLFTSYDPEDGPEEDGPTGVGGYLDALAKEVGDPGTVLSVHTPPTWEERFRAVSSRAEAAALYGQASKEFAPGTQGLNRLVALGMAALAALEQRTG